MGLISYSLPGFLFSDVMVGIKGWGFFFLKNIMVPLIIYNVIVTV